MGTQYRFGTAGATGGGWSAQPGTLQPAYEESRHEPRWGWQARSPKTNKDRNAWISRWSFGARIGYGAPSGSDGVTTQMDLSTANNYEPWSADGPGNQSLKFIKGRCEDVAGNALSGVNVKAYRTSDDAYAGYVVQSRTDGSYDLPTQFTPVNHYVVAYIAGSPDRAGTTVNTLVPANIDGT